MYLMSNRKEYVNLLITLGELHIGKPNVECQNQRQKKTVNIDIVRYRFTDIGELPIHGL